ncbi:hypothetical protein CEQ90_17300 [Lewinellaceae bacterium SD302]|nr:hypothetical protein CEQ90_17300 [Lewinellaceae bacterium SD302]
MTQDLDPSSSYGNFRAIYPAMSKPFSTYWPVLKEILESQGMSWSATYGLDEQHPGRSVGLSRQKIKKLSTKVVLDLLGLRQATSARWVDMQADLDTALGQALSCLRWYGPMIGAKFARVIYTDPDREALVTQQADSPTIKLLHLVLVRAIAAATTVMQERSESVNILLPLTLDYCALLNYLRTTYPKAHLLQRTAFDSPRYANEIKAYYNGYLPIDPFRDNSWSVGGRAPSE